MVGTTRCSRARKQPNPPSRGENPTAQGTLVPVDPKAMFLSTLQLVLVPVLAGAAVNQYFPKASPGPGAGPPRQGLVRCSNP